MKKQIKADRHHKVTTHFMNGMSVIILMSGVLWMAWWLIPAIRDGWIASEEGFFAILFSFVGLIYISVAVGILKRNPIAFVGALLLGILSLNQFVISKFYNPTFIYLDGFSLFFILWAILILIERKEFWSIKK
jgi:hypothetical protein